MKKQKERELIFIAIIVICIFFLLKDIASAQQTFPPDETNLRANFTDDFADRPTTFVYTDENGIIKVDSNYRTRIGLYRKDYDAVRLPTESQLGNLADILPDAGLAAEHHWFSFELTMKAQRELKGCLEGWAEHHLLFGVPPVHYAGQPYYEDILNVTEYWVPFNILDNYEEHPPGRLTYIEHFKAGIIGENNAINWRDWCRPLRLAARQNTQNYLQFLYEYIYWLEVAAGIR